MSKERDAMKLQPGKTCDDCGHFRFCFGIGCTWKGRTECDYYPNRFYEQQEKVEGKPKAK